MGKKIEFTNGNLRHIEVDKTGRIYIMGFFKILLILIREPLFTNYFQGVNPMCFHLNCLQMVILFGQTHLEGLEMISYMILRLMKKEFVFSRDFEDTVDFDPGSGQTIYISGHTNFGDNLESAFTQKLDKNGDFIWAKPFLSIDTCGYCNGISINLDKNSNIYCTGKFAGNFDFDPGNDIHIPSLYEYGTYVENWIV